MTEEAQSAESAPEVYQNVVATRASRNWIVGIILAVIAAIVFFKTTKATMHDFDYTARIASALLHGHLGLDRNPGSWLNELVPFERKYYSVFPLGAVLSVLPVALLQQVGWIHSFPAQFLTALIAGLCVFFFFGLSSVETKSIARRIILALFPIFGTWTWCNLGFGGSWQIALGFAFYLGSTMSFHCRRVLRARFRESHRIDSHPADFSLLVVHETRWQRGDRTKQHWATTSQKGARVDLLYGPTVSSWNSNGVL